MGHMFSIPPIPHCHYSLEAGRNNVCCVPRAGFFFFPLHKCSVFNFFSYHHCSLPSRIWGKLLPSLQSVMFITQSLLLPPFLLQETSPTNEFHLYVEVETEGLDFLQLITHGHTSSKSRWETLPSPWLFYFCLFFVHPATYLIPLVSILWCGISGKTPTLFHILNHLS